ncbi:unnamed protein product [Rotaria magnacalcarata]|uniref:G-protein coupled receptors family 1 profile domain-containing protein n=1 Tax=Rotaria magnacalcarata TaxID=392030 RepID=A0A816FE44_9BILA|nr:unnamed protein product [Rotaria magnacalcarata]CAF1660364.1 unnamed protein product [Rotaria magnacalcarata]CAF2227582.1 unnamed protein product [Rotaria magnacalcarata]CAF3807281.1 unnamed protein product [Rotaria magnacalcarata]CAF4004006.1 unnamed protein product [Rotaria magnacalcarata]
MNIEINQTTIINNDYEKEVFESIQIICGLYLIPIVCVPGLIGNILCIIIFITNSMQRFLTTQFLLFLAITDVIKLSNDLLYSIVLIIQALNQQYGKKLFLILYRYCHYINTVSTLCAAWLTLIVAIERYVLCSANNRKRAIVQKNSRIICYLIIFCSLILALPVSFRYEIVPLSTNNQTLNNSDSLVNLSKFGSSRLFRAYSITIDLIRAIIPSLLLFYLNTRIIYLLYRMKSSAGTAFSRLTISLIIIIGCFICCYFPDALLSLILNMGYINESYQKRAIREITDFFVTFNSAINFPVYFSISYTFQRSVLRLFKRKGKTYSTTTYDDVILRQQQQPLNNIRNIV